MKEDSRKVSKAQERGAGTNSGSPQRRKQRLLRKQEGMESVQDVGKIMCIPHPEKRGRMRRLTEWSKQKALLAPEGGVLLCGVRRQGHQRGDVSVDTGEQGVQHSGGKEKGHVGERERKEKEAIPTH